MNSAPPPPYVPAAPSLFMDYAGRRYSINVPRFIIGREKGQCHLVIPDPNVSRQHAAVELAQGAFFIVDLGSRNGVGYSGHRIRRKQIVEGDQFEINGHTIGFSFRNP